MKISFVLISLALASAHAQVSFEQKANESMKLKIVTFDNPTYKGIKLLAATAAEGDTYAKNRASAFCKHLTYEGYSTYGIIQETTKHSVAVDLVSAENNVKVLAPVKTTSIEIDDHYKEYRGKSHENAWVFTQLNCLEKTVQKP